MKNKVRVILISLLILIISLVGVGVFVKGKPGNYQYDHNAEVGGPFESSNTNSRFILTEAMVNNGSYLLTERQAHFAAPDVVYYHNTFFSIFTPGISYLAVPLYWLGSKFGLPQLFAFFTTLIFAILNVFLVARLASKFGANIYLSYALGLTFLFGTNALAYSLTLTQHHYSVTVILLAILNALAAKRTLWNNLAFGLIFTAGVLFDIPNAFMLAPVVVYVIAKHLEVTQKDHILKIFMNPIGFWVVVAMIPLLSLFGYYNLHTSGSPTLIGQNLGQTDYFDSAEKKQQRALEDLKDGPTTVKSPFNTRKQLSGFYILLFSDERGIFYYDLVILVGILGLILAYKHQRTLVSLAASVILVNIVLYSAFGDAWGGWSFGPRYLIPSIALLLASSGGISLIRNWKYKYAVLSIFFITLCYSVFVNTLGALTTNAIPPKVEAQALAHPLPYTYKLNLNLVNENKSSSLFYNALLTNIVDLKTVHWMIVVLMSAIITSLFTAGVLRKEK